MSFNSERIINEIHESVEKMIGQMNKKATADQMEREIFRMMLQLGAQLLALFFAQRSEACERTSAQLKNGTAVPYYQEKSRRYVSIFGALALRRPYFYQQGVGGISPLDGELNLKETSYSDLVCEWLERLGVQGAYHRASELMAEIFGLSLSSRIVHEQLKHDAQAVLDYYAQKAAPCAAEEAELLVIQADGKGVPMVRESQESTPVRLGKGDKKSRKKEAIVTAVYTLAATPRTPQAVVDSLFQQNPPLTATPQRPLPQHKQLAATLDGKAVALHRLHQQTVARQGPHIQAQLALCDGCEALQTHLLRTFPDFTLVLDFIHANEYLWQVATALWGEASPVRLPWMQQQTLRLLSGQAADLIQDFRHRAQLASPASLVHKQLLTTAAYFERNLPYMDYPTYLARGWPIASGVIEGACRHLVKDRCELSGMRWSLTGAEALLRLRAVAENGDWDDFHTFRKQQRRAKLYLFPQATSASPEQLMLAA